MHKRIWLALLLVLLLAGCGLLGEDATSETGEGSEVVLLDPASGAAVDGSGAATAQPEAVEGNPAPASSQQMAVTRPLPPAVFVALPASAAVSAGTTVTHVVAEGEWLLQIARCYGASYTAVRAANPAIANPNMILPGATVVVPNAGSIGPISPPPCVVAYTVTAVDTWESIAAAYHSSAAILRQANPGALVAGRVIYVPNHVQTAVTGTVQLSHDLVFIYDGDLAVWQASDGRTAVFPDEATILDIATHADGDWVLLRQTRDQGASTEMALVNLANNTITLLESGLPAIARDAAPFQTREVMWIAPDGDFGAYLLPQGNGYQLTTFATADPNTLYTLGGIAHGGNEYVLPQLFADKFSGGLLLLDGGGIFAYDVALTGEQSVATLAGDIGVQGYEAVAWSPDAAYLLLRQLYFEGSDYGVLDVATGQVVTVPNSSGYVMVAAVSWLPTGDLVLFAPPVDENSGPTRTVFRPQNEGGTLTLTPQGTESLIMPEDGVGTAFGYVFAAPRVQVNEEMVVALQTAETIAPGIFTVPTGSVTLTRQNTLPAPFGLAQWAVDGSGALLTLFAPSAAVGDVVYAPTGGDTVFSLVDWLGSSIGDFHWVTAR